MALNSGKILMRRGQEVNFDPNKMTPGEWAVSLDSKYVRMCFSPGVCVRMATYDAFEADMEQIRQILAECETVEEAVQRIYEDIKDVAVDVERIEAAAASALESEENALNSANLAVQSANTATQKASEAAESADIASTKAEEATEGASTATQKASEAAESADNVRNMSDVSQSYAVGGTGTREGEDTDNSKYYNQQASDNADRAEAAAERASSVADVGVATIEKAGLVRPDGETIRVDPDGTIHADRGTTSYNDLENKPKINDVVLEGEKTLEELGIASKEALEKTDSKVNIIIEQAELRFKENASGENIHLDDSADSKLVEFGMYGKAKQNTTTGKNLIRFPYVGGSSGIVTVLDNGEIKISGTTTNDVWFAILNNASNINPYYLPSGTYTLSVEATAPMDYINIGIINVSNGSTIVSKALSGLITEVTFTIDSETNISIRTFVGTGRTVNTTIYPMLRLASITDNTWEPYTGGIPSPNPEYPQDIEVSGESGSVEVKSVGKNLLPYPYNGFVHTDRGITWTDNKDGTVTANGTATSDAAFYFNEKHIFKAGNYILNGCPSGGSNSSYRIQLANSDWTVNYLDIGDGASVTLEENTKLEQFRIFIAKGTTVPNLTFKPMLRLASDTDSTYEPYKSKTATIPTENGLAGIPVDSGGNYTDSNGQQWICDEIVKYADGSGEKIQRVGIIDSYSAETITGVYMSTTGELTEGAKILYQLAKPITTSLTAEELAEIEKLSTFYSVTNMSNDADCGMKVKYIADAKSYIDNRLALIEQAMLNSI